MSLTCAPGTMLRRRFIRAGKVGMLVFATMTLSLFVTRVLLMPVASVTSLGQDSDELNRRYAEAARRVVRLPATAFPELPANVVRELQRRTCTVPQSYPVTKRSNVISGQFAKPGQTDWAVMCSAKGASSILVFWNGTANVSEIGPKAEDRIYVGFNTDGSNLPADHPGSRQTVHCRSPPCVWRTEATTH